MNVLILGSGGREHAFAWKLSQSKKLTKLFIAPGNAGTAMCGTNVAMSATDFPAIRTFVLEHKIEMVIVGPEDPLVKGVHDFFLADTQLKNIPVIGPPKAGAQLEGSKDFSKQFMIRHKIPTAAYETFTKDSLDAGYKFLEKLSPPYVLKADGLAAGKGVVIPTTLDAAKAELKAMLADAKFGDASSKVVIEEFLKGIELSVFVLTDGVSYKLLPAAKDYKRIGDGDTGLNTGGMGAVSPVPFADEAFLEKVEERIVIPTIEGLKKDNIPYVGFIFIGLMNDNGDPKVIEYNCRMGDPETEVVLPRIKSDLLETFIAVAEKKLSSFHFELDNRTATTVMMVAGGYPGDYEKGKIISGLEKVKDAVAFHAGTKNENGNVVTNGGRIIAFTALGNSIPDAIKKSYDAANEVKFEGCYFRKDIGKDLL
ncbi:MAG TPA: phosphoribosylamine--glycine ligase [Bacteroidia bacterium]|jgi:phosphoribosylamine--glycine ligase|nr:phosphoribosylamine--glycine ligase [Bacteroidia bacterium]